MRKWMTQNDWAINPFANQRFCNILLSTVEGSETNSVVTCWMIRWCWGALAELPTLAPLSVWIWFSALASIKMKCGNKIGVDHCLIPACMLLLLLSRFSRVQLCVTPSMAAYQAPPSLGFSRQEHWSGLPVPSCIHLSQYEMYFL